MAAAPPAAAAGLGRQPGRSFLDGAFRGFLIGHYRPVHQPGVDQLDVALLGGAGHQLLETGKAELLFVKGGVAAHQALLDAGQQGVAAGGPFVADDFLDGADNLPQFGGGVGDRRAARRGVLRQHRRLRVGRRRRGIDILVVQQQRVHLVGQVARSAPRHADDHHPLAHRAQGVDHMEEVGIAGHQHESADVGVGMGAFDTVGGHFDVDAVLDAVGAHPVGGGGGGGRDAGRHENGFDAGGVERGGVVDELAGAAQLGGAGDPVGVGFGHHHAALLGDLLPQRGQVGAAVAAGEADLEVFPVDE